MSLQSMIRERGLKQGYLAKELGIDETAFSYIVRGLKPLPDDKVGPLARLLRMKKRDLVAGMSEGGEE